MKICTIKSHYNTVDPKFFTRHTVYYSIQVMFFPSFVCFKFSLILYEAHTQINRKVGICLSQHQQSEQYWVWYKQVQLASLNQHVSLFELHTNRHTVSLPHKPAHIKFQNLNKVLSVFVATKKLPTVTNDK